MPGIPLSSMQVTCCILARFHFRKITLCGEGWREEGLKATEVVSERDILSIEQDSGRRLESIEKIEGIKEGRWDLRAA